MEMLRKRTPLKMRSEKNIRKGKNGFTLFEIIVVLIVLGVIAAFAVPRLLTIADKTRDRNLSEAVGELKERISLYFKLQLSQGTTASAIDCSSTTIDMDLGSDYTATITSHAKADPITGTVTINDGSGRTMNWSMTRPDS
jgi:prepilin-type N-terminal cleavage/methylation domain-containing protein